jgi:hypothetical protein
VEKCELFDEAAWIVNNFSPVIVRNSLRKTVNWRVNTPDSY